MYTMLPGIEMKPLPPPRLFDIQYVQHIRVIFGQFLLMVRGSLIVQKISIYIQSPRC